MKGKVLLFRGRGVVSALIRWQTRGPYSHAALLYPDNRTIIEAWHSGVRKAQVEDWNGIDIFDVPEIDDWTSVFAYAEARLGKKYDFLSVARFVTRQKPPMGDEREFCSELVFGALATKVKVLARIDAANVSPTHLGWSPKLFLTVAGGPAIEESVRLGHWYGAYPHPDTALA